VTRMPTATTHRRARTQTVLLSLALATIAVTLAVAASMRAARQPVTPMIATAGVTAAIAVAFFVTEQTLVNFEFRHQSYSLTFSGVPLAMGILLLPVDELVAARLVGSLAALLWQRIAAERVAYNAAAFCFEAAVSATLLHVWLPLGGALSLRTVGLLLVVVAAVDQLMSMLVLLVIRLHGGPVGRADVTEVLTQSVELSVVSTLMASVLLILIRQGVVGALLAAAMVITALFVYRTYAASSRRHQSLAVVHDFVTEGVGAETVEELAATSLARIRHVLRASDVQLRLCEPAPGGPDPDTEKYLLLGLDESNRLTTAHSQVRPDWVQALALHRGEPTLATRGGNAPISSWLKEQNLADAIVVPVRTGTTILGTLSVTGRMGETATFTRDDLTMLQTLTSHFAVAITSARMMEKLSYEATHDALTGLANRAYLSNQINALDPAGPSSAALLLDLDKFKEVNDVLGHDVGDQLLIVVARRLHECLPADAVVARLGGDEFAVLLRGDDPGPATLARRAAERILEPVWFAEALLTPQVSIGIARSATVAPNKLLSSADTAMYVAKGRNEPVAVYETSMDAGRAERLALVADLRMALEQAPQQFELYYQPKIDLATGVVVSCEALVRWQHPGLGTLAPDRFIPLAETTGLIDQLTMHLVTVALIECAVWQRRGHEVTVAVNLSARNLSNATVIRHIAEAITAAGARPEWLILEITESSVMQNPEEAIAALSRFSRLGVCLSLDDFGTGYSSLSYLQRMPVRELKIDQSFVSTLAGGVGSDSDSALFRSIITLGENLNMRVVAEGVETKTQLDAVTTLGCQVGQGYLISHPLDAPTFQLWLDNYTPPGGRPHLVKAVA
jgi:diguanylate cyclase (GGDEF)-like protein